MILAKVSDLVDKFKYKKVCKRTKKVISPVGGSNP